MGKSNNTGVRLNVTQRKILKQHKPLHWRHMACQIIGICIVYSIFCTDVRQRML